MVNEIDDNCVPMDISEDGVVDDSDNELTVPLASLIRTDDTPVASSAKYPVDYDAIENLTSSVEVVDKDDRPLNVRIGDKVSWSVVFVWILVITFIDRIGKLA